MLPDLRRQRMRVVQQSNRSSAKQEYHIFKENSEWSYLIFGAIEKPTTCYIKQAVGFG